jgi:anaerobic magnesium-protoporphyrin IX monomethyl ester cyclase
MNELLLFVRPPRPIWPFNGPSTSFWPPLAFASMAAMLRQHVPELRVEILDAPPLQMGWKSLEAELRKRKPAVVALGEEAVSCAECLRLARAAKAVGAQVIAGGCFFGHVAPQVLATGLVDVVAHGEGENTIVELAHALREGTADALANVAGISFLRDGQVVRTRPRPLIKNLDDLPMPAWDLLPMRWYGAESRNHPGLAAIEASRGCFDACEFCVLWRQMGNFVSEQLRPYVRMKSPERLLEEIRIQTRDYNRRHLGWVDPCFNAHPRVPAELAEALMREDIRVGQSAWVRADCLVRDAQSGALATYVRGGLNEVYVGVERPDGEGLKAIHKTTTIPIVREAFRILAQDHPHVFTLGTFIYGLPGDTPDTVRAIFRLSHELEMNHAFFIPLTPLPGTPYWSDDLWDDSGETFRDFNFLPSATRPGARRDLEWALLLAAAFLWTPARVRTYWRGLSGHSARKRRVTLRLAARTAWFAAHGMLRGLLTGHRAGMVFPRWYES